MDAHVQRHLDNHAAVGRPPRVLANAEEAVADGAPEVMYPLRAGVYAHIHERDGVLRYDIVEPTMAPHQRLEADALRERLAATAASLGNRTRAGDLRDALRALLLEMAPEARGTPMEEHLLRDMAGYGPLDPLLADGSLEDIHLVGLAPVHVIHARHGMMPTNVRFDDPIALVRFLRLLCERLGRPVSDTTPIVDAMLPDGSRMNLVYSSDVSRRGPSLSVRRAPDRPVTIMHLLRWGTLTPEAAAYLWLCLEHGMSMFLCGEAACGKTTTLNAVLPFIDPRSKIYSAEDTPEVRPPHGVWQRLLTRDTGPESSRVRMFDLLKAALRSRPDYIVVGEIRGAEGAVAFQAMQTGHPTIGTFHATDPTSLVQRLGAAPISVPLTFMDNLNVVVFQQIVRVGERRERRVTKIMEIAGVAPEGVVSIPAFEWDPVARQLKFRGLNNSHVLETKIAALRGLRDPRGIYDVVRERAATLRAWLDDGVVEAAEIHERLGHVRSA